MQQKRFAAGIRRNLILAFIFHLWTHRQSTHHDCTSSYHRAIFFIIFSGSYSSIRRFSRVASTAFFIYYSYCSDQGFLVRCECTLIAVWKERLPRLRKTLRRQSTVVCASRDAHHERLGECFMHVRFRQQSDILLLPRRRPHLYSLISLFACSGRPPTNPPTSANICEIKGSGKYYANGQHFTMLAYLG